MTLISIQHFFDEYRNADLNDPAVRDYLLDYFVDKIFVYDDKVILTAWYGDDKKEITWGDIDCVVVKDRKRKKRSSASGSVPPLGGSLGYHAPGYFLFTPLPLLRGKGSETPQRTR